MSRTCASVAATGGALARTIAGGGRAHRAAPRSDVDGAPPPTGPAGGRGAGAPPAAGKGRSRQRGKRDDEDGWPSTEWDKVSDERYWAEGPADKPLSAMAKPSRPASDSGAKAPGNGSAKRAVMPPAAREPRPAKAPAPALPERGVPSRKGRTEPRQPVTERLPVRTRQQPPTPPRPRAAHTPPARSRLPEPRTPRDTRPHAPPHP